MTPLTKPVSRRTNKRIGRRPVVVTLAPCGGQDDALIGLRLLGARTQYVVALSDIYRIAAVWHGQAEAAAKKAARKNGTPWRTAKRAFLASKQIV